MDKLVLVQEQGGNVTYDISGFRRIDIRDEAAELRQINPDTPELFSICVSFGLDGKGKHVLLGRYIDYQDAFAYYTELVSKLASGSTFISMVPGEDLEMPDRAG